MNPLTSLRKLGVSLVGGDGLLNSAAAIHLGYGPMAQVKQALEARNKAQADNATDLKYKTDQFSLERDIAKAKQEADLFPIKKQQEQFNLDKSKAEEQRQATEFSHTEDDRIKKQREEEAINQELARSFKLPPDQARAKFDAMAAMERAGVMLTESMSPEVKKYLGISDNDIFAFKSNIEIAKGIAQEKANKAREERMYANEERRTKEAQAREERLRQGDVDQEARSLRGYLKNLDTLLSSKAGVDAEFASYKDKLNKSPYKTLVLDQALINGINKIFDPNSVVREGEYDRTTKAAPMLDRLRMSLHNLTKGGTLTPELLDALKESYDRAMNAVAETYNGHVRRFQNRYNISDDQLESQFFELFDTNSNKDINKYLDPNYEVTGRLPSPKVSPRITPTPKPTPIVPISAADEYINKLKG